MQLTAENLKAHLNYSPETGYFTRIKTSGGAQFGAIAGAVRGDGYIQISVSGHKYMAHRLAWLYTHGTFPPNEIDHINGNRADNRITNLRCASHAENSQNKTSYKNSKSGLIGVSWCKQTQKWAAHITLDRVNRKIGRYATKEEASDAYAKAKAKAHKFNPVARQPIES